MSDIFTKRGRFQSDKLPLDEIEGAEPKEFVSESPGDTRWGWYPFLYESPFTAANIPAGLTPFDFGGGEDFPSWASIGFDAGSGAEELGGSGGGGATVEDFLHDVTKKSCPLPGELVELPVPDDPNEASDTPERDDYCKSILTPCEFFNYLAALEKAIVQGHRTAGSTGSEFLALASTLNKQAFTGVIPGTNCATNHPAGFIFTVTVTMCCPAGDVNCCLGGEGFSFNFLLQDALGPSTICSSTNALCVSACGLDLSGNFRLAWNSFVMCATAVLAGSCPECDISGWESAT